MSLPTLNGIALNISTLLGEMRKTADYIYFDGPLLSHYRGPGGVSYLRYWCDVDGDQNRWMLFKVSEQDRLSYLDRQVALHGLILSEQNPFVYMIETAKDGEVVSTTLVPAENIPSDYLPSTDSIYEFEPRNVSVEGAKAYTILIGERWSLRDLGEFRRLYERSYSFVYALSEMFPVGIRMASLQRAFSSLPWKGAFSPMHFFNQMISLVPRNASPEVLSISYASPGWIELSLSIDVAFLVRQMALFVNTHRDKIQEEIDTMYDTLRPYNMLGNKGRPIQDIVDQTEIALTKQQYLIFCKAIQFPLSDELLSATPNPLAALKILIAFTRRLWQLNDFSSGNKVRL